jgi:hypothetical protein
MRVRTALLLILLAASRSASAQDFNNYINKSVDYLASKYKGGGYDISSAFTHDLGYDGKGVIKATRPLPDPRETMCVAASMEVIIEAIKLYADDTGDASVFDKIPLDAWTKGNILSLRANIFMYSGTGSRGTAFTLAEFGLGEELRFQDLKRGDFINLNRTNNTGHSVVFQEYIGRDGEIINYGPNVVGFRYFSAQGKGKPDAGFGFRNAFFEGYCPSNSGNSGVLRDCGIIRSNNRALLDTGRMWSADRWAYAQAIAGKKVHARSVIEDENPDVSRSVIDQLLDDQLNKELEMSPDRAAAFTGDTTD